jgi:hypothetical protein
MDQSQWMGLVYGALLLALLAPGGFWAVRRFGGGQALVWAAGWLALFVVLVYGYAYFAG